MIYTNNFCSKEDLKKLKTLIQKGWQHGETMIVFSVGEGIRKDKKTQEAKEVCHRLALEYGLPEIKGYYGITNKGEFVSY